MQTSQPTLNHPSDHPQRGPTVPAFARLLSSNKFLTALVFCATAIAITLGALSEGRELFDRDEEIYVRVIKLFDQGFSLELLRSYGGEPASPAPLFFMVYAGWGKLLGFSYPMFRGLSLVITLLTVAGFSLFLHKQASRDQRIFFPSLLFLFPYIFCMSFSVMAEPLTLMFTVVGLCCYLHGLARGSDAVLLVGTIAIAAAMHVRIHAVFVPAGLMVVLLLQKDLSVRRWCIAAAPLLARLPLFVLQGGLTVSREAFTGTKPELGVCPVNINLSLVWFGYMFFPLLWWCRGRRSINLLATLALIPFYILVTPDFLGPEHRGALRTLFLQLELSATAAQLLAFPAWLIGCYLTVDVIQRVLSAVHLRDMFLGSCIVMFMLSLVFSTVAFERYYVLAVPAVILLGVGTTARPGAFIAMAVCHVLYIALSAARLVVDLP